MRLVVSNARGILELMRILVVDDDAFDRDTVSRVAARAGHDVTVAEDGISAVQFAEKRGDYDVALVDLGMAGMDGVATIAELRALRPELHILVVSGYDDPDHVLGALQAGADGYIVKTDIATRLADALSEVVNGGGPMSTKIARYVIEAFRKPQPAEGALSRREWEVVDALSKSASYADIGKLMGITVNTVRHHIRNLYKKLGVSGKAQAIERAEKLKEKLTAER
jgi:DNA-binding NarL/FixJ family response regulator